MGRPEPSPLPGCVVVSAFPSAVAQARPPVPDAHGRPVPLRVMIRADAAQVQCPADLPWLRFSGPESLGTGLSCLLAQADDNPRAGRRAALQVTVAGRAWPLQVVQQPGLLVQTEMLQVLNAPLALDLEVAVTWIASLINDIEVPPVQVLVTVLAVLALLALGLIAAVVRRLFTTVPAPCPLSPDTLGQPVLLIPGVPVPEAGPLQALPAVDQTIGLQTVRAVFELLRQIE